MAKHPLDPGEGSTAGERTMRFAGIERKLAPEGSHPAVKAVIKRTRKTATEGELLRVKRLNAT